jgi:hypothetical protein
LKGAARKRSEGMSTFLSKFYQILDGQTVILKITIGHAQLGTTSVSLGTDPLAIGHHGTLELELPPPGTDLDGKTLFCSTVVADVQTQTNETSVTYELTGGATEFRQTLQETVEHEGDIMFYTATFRFYL